MHYHLSQHGVFSEKEMRFYASEIILGLEHMHNRFVVYRDLKVRRVGWCPRPPGVPLPCPKDLSLSSWSSLGPLCDHSRGGTCGRSLWS